MAMVKKEISSIKYWKESFRETAVCSLNSPHKLELSPQEVVD